MVNPVPWDPFLLDRFGIFLQKMAEHKVYAKKLNKEVAFNEHPALVALVVGIPGYGLLRPLDFGKIDLPGYARDTFVDAVLAHLRHVHEAFPRPGKFVGLWRMSDNEQGEPLHEELRRRILETFSGNFGFYQDNLAAAKRGDGQVKGFPNTDFAAPLFLSKNLTSIGFQALQSWKKPFANEQKVMDAGPGDGIRHGFESFNAKYFELYVSDVDNPDYWPSLRDWKINLCSGN
jgi:hypothetical protein